MLRMQNQNKSLNRPNPPPPQKYLICFKNKNLFKNLSSVLFQLTVPRLWRQDDAKLLEIMLKFQILPDKGNITFNNNK